MSKPVKAILFDLGGVIVNLDFQRTIDSFTKLGFKDIATKISQKDQNSFFYKYKLGLINTNDFRNNISSQITGTFTDNEIDSMWNKMILDIPQYKLELLLELRKKYNVYLLSNANELHWLNDIPLFNYKGHTVNDFFNEVFLSFKMHKAKPAKNAFEYVIEQTGIEPDETIFVDDSEENCKVARTLGFRAIRYMSGSNLRDIMSHL